jgi:tetratricopeptide (TPR) repeat protein
MCGLWEESKGVLHKSRQLQEKTAPNANTHDDVEFALFEARWRASLESSSLLDELKACVRANDASPSHRVVCGLLGLKIAAGENQIDVMEELYLTMGPLFESPKIATATRLEVEMIYHSTCGDMRRAEKATDQLLVAVDDEPDPRMRTRALLNVGVAYRLAGRGDDAEAVLLELLEYSVPHGLLGRASFALLALARVYLAAGDLPRAREAMQKLEALTGDEQDHHLAGDRNYMFARLALDEGNVQEAAERYLVLAAQTSPSKSVNRKSAVLALGIRIGIQQNASTEGLRRMVAEHEAAHLQNRSAGAQDFEAHALALGLRYCGELEKGLLLLAEYVTTYRREKWTLPQYLSDLLLELRGSYAVSPTLRKHSLSAVV